jgi:hypothetical protein
MLRDRLGVNNAQACHGADRQIREAFVLDVEVLVARIFVDTVNNGTDHDDVGLDFILLGNKVEVI